MVNGPGFLAAATLSNSRIDLSDIPEAQIGDEVVIVGEQGDHRISPEEVADLCKMGGSRFTRTVRKHIPRLFYKNGRPYKLVTLLGEEFF